MGTNMAGKYGWDVFNKLVLEPGTWGKPSSMRKMRAKMAGKYMGGCF